ncbi:MAG: exopolysaccharide biosynthesis protein [Caulobacteraceae bacterium]|nr:exopolysaccharide biosynthesis protein [Caulobacteraceae bacterium]
MALDESRSALNWHNPAKDMPFGGALKRACDLSIALPILLFLAPLMLFLAFAVKMRDGGPIFFVHSRVGRDGRLFSCLKFRSMIVDAEHRMQSLLRDDPDAAREWAEKQKLTHDPRVTPVGRVLRATSADELPQLINVVLGDMSLVGPRPITPDQIDEYGPGFARYCTARPGITGIWQVSGRNETTFRRRSEYDQVYLKAWSLPTDLALLVRTVDVVVRRRGAC